MRIQHLVKICQFVIKDIERKRNSGEIKGKNELKIICNNPNLDIVNINAHKTFGKNLSFYSKDIERKRIYDRRTEKLT